MGKQKTTLFSRKMEFFSGVGKRGKGVFFLDFWDVFRLFGIVVLEGWQEKFLRKLWITAFFVSFVLVFLRLEWSGYCEWQNHRFTGGLRVAVWFSSLGTMGGGLVRIGKGGFFGGDREKRAWACFWSGFGKKFGL